MSESLSQEKMEEIEYALKNSRMIEAIKIYREATGVDLKEAKEFIEDLATKTIQKDQVKHAALAKSKGAGCSGVLLLFIGGAIAAML